MKFYFFNKKQDFSISVNSNDNNENKDLLGFSSNKTQKYTY